MIDAQTWLQQLREVDDTLGGSCLRVSRVFPTMALLALKKKATPFTTPFTPHPYNVTHPPHNARDIRSRHAMQTAFSRWKVSRRSAVHARFLEILEQKTGTCGG